MKVSSKHCDWGILYAGDDSLNVVGALKRSCASSNITLQFVERAYTADEALKKFLGSEEEYDNIKKILGPNFRSKAVPKSFLLMQIIPYARKYNYVWMLDSDITFEEFEIDKYFETMRGLPQSPLLLQPVVGKLLIPINKVNL